MKSLRLLLAALSLLVAPLWFLQQPAAEALMYAPLPPSKDLYSFADLYRLTASADWPLAAAANGSAAPQRPTFSAQFAAQFSAQFPELQVRTVAGEAFAAAPASPYVFSIDRAAAPGGGPLLLAGLAAGLWVARRRLGYAIRG